MNKIATEKRCECVKSEVTNIVQRKKSLWLCTLEIILTMHFGNHSDYVLWTDNKQQRQSIDLPGQTTKNINPFTS